MPKKEPQKIVIEEVFGDNDEAFHEAMHMYYFIQPAERAARLAEEERERLRNSQTKSDDNSNETQNESKEE